MCSGRGVVEIDLVGGDEPVVVLSSGNGCKCGRCTCGERSKGEQVKDISDRGPEIGLMLIPALARCAMRPSIRLTQRRGR